MINVSNAFKQELFNDRRNYLEYIDITLKDGTVLKLTNKDLWGGGLTIEDAVSKGNSFDVGSAIINKCKVVISNIYDEFSEYDFGDANVVVYVGLNLPDGTTERIRKGTYTVDEAAYNGSIITLQCFDHMQKFDRPYTDSKLTYPATLNQIIRDACSVCGVVLQTYNFPHDTFIVQTRPDDEAITFREIISWCAQIACCFCRCDTLGRLELKWYNQKILEETALDGGDFGVYDLGDKVDGGDFRTWNHENVISGGEFGDRRGMHLIYSVYSLDIATDDVVITGAKVLEKNKEENQDAITTYQSGTDGYVVSVENNELIKGGAGQNISGWIGEQLIGFRFRKASITHASDPTIEAGDVGYLNDRKGNIYRIIVSSTNFSTGNSQNTVSSAQNPARNSAARFSAETKNYVEFRKDIEKERTDREKAQDELKNRIDNSSGLYTTEIAQTDGGTIFYMHDKPILAESMIVWKMTAEAWGVSTDGGKTYNAGMTVDGDTIVRILTATGINADWIKTGAFQITKNGKTMVLMDTKTGQVILRPDVFELSSGKTIDSIAQEKADTALGDAKTYADTAASNAVDGQTQEDIFDKLFKPNGVKIDGIELRNGKIYISATYIDTGEMSADRINGGTLTLGGKNNQNGILCIKNASNTEIGRWDKDGINAEGDISLKKNIEGEIYTASIGSVKYDDGILSRTSGGLQINGEMVAMENGLRNCNPCILQTKTVDGYYTQLTINPKDVQLMHYYTNPGAVGGDIGGGGFIAFKSERDSNGKSKVYMNAGKVYFRGDNDYGVYIYAQNQNSSSTTAAFTSEGGYYRLCRGTSSSKRYKNIKRSMDFSDIENLYGIQPVIACFKDGILAENDIRNGMYYPMFVAEDVEKYFPEAVDRNEDGSVENWNEKIMIPAMFQMIKSQKETIDNLTDRICRLESLLTKGNE